MAIVGATATGKTALAVSLARLLGDCELVSVDAMAVYKGFDIGTAKPTAAERAGLVWHLLDLVEPHEEFSVAEFQRAARDAGEEIASRGHRTIFVGGTGLYHRAVVDGLELPGRYPEVAASLELEADALGPERLHDRLAALDPVAAARIEPANRRRIVRALEVTLGSGVPFSASGAGLDVYGDEPVIEVGLGIDRAALDRRIADRLDDELAAGFLEEVRELARRPLPWSRTAHQALGYRELREHLEGALSYEDAVSSTLRRTRRFARRQERWFRRDPRVHWFDARSESLLDDVASLVASRD